MNLESYRERRRQLALKAPRFRESCLRCRQPQSNCYCARVKKLDCGIRFYILIHPIEARRRIATGRMSYLSLRHSQLIEGEDFSSHPAVESVLNDPETQSVVLYPGRNSTNLRHLTNHARATLFERKRDLAVFVIDGTWAHARKMMRSTNLIRLPRICFSLDRPSGFSTVRKQPAEGCFSTIEAIHQTIELLGPSRGFDITHRAHDHLLSLFDEMVQRQLQFTPQTTTRHPPSVVLGPKF